MRYFACECCESERECLVGPGPGPVERWPCRRIRRGSDSDKMLCDGVCVSA